MTDADQTELLQNEVAHLKSELASHSLLVAQLARSADSGRQSTQAAVDNLQEAVDLIFRHVHVPNVVFRAGVRHIIK